jgi:hypothetical protein
VSRSARRLTAARRRRSITVRPILISKHQ